MIAEVRPPRAWRRPPMPCELRHVPQVCDDLPMRHPIQPDKRDDVLEACQACYFARRPAWCRSQRGALVPQDFWEEYEDDFVKMIFDRSAAFALSLCSEVVEVCEADMSPSELFAFDPTNPSKDEL